jgi:hypothetical protein
MGNLDSHGYSACCSLLLGRNEEKEREREQMRPWRGLFSKLFITTKYQWEPPEK